MISSLTPHLWVEGFFSLVVAVFVAAGPFIRFPEGPRAPEAGGDMPLQISSLPHVREGTHSRLSAVAFGAFFV